MTTAASLPEPRRSHALAAFGDAGTALREALADQAETARVHGARALAETTFRPGSRPAAEIEAAWRDLLGLSPDTAAPKAA